MKVAIITDQHFGCRKNSKIFHDYFLKFYNNIFFPTLEEYEIKTVIDLGDTFDTRKSIDFSALHWAKENYYNILNDIGCSVYTVVGNHTAYYKNTNKINTVSLLLKEYNNIKIISDPEECKIGNLDILFIPWINSENEKITMDSIKSTNCQVAMGHLELNGFLSHRGHVCEQGMDNSIFSKFKYVFSGHYHTRSNNGKIFYLGNPYEMYWNDYDDLRGFHIFDTETFELISINNPYKMFSVIEYDEDTINDSVFDEVENKIIKLIVKNKTNHKKFDYFVDKLCGCEIHDLKIIEKVLQIDTDINSEDNFEDTLTTITNYIKNYEMELDKFKIIDIVNDLYKNASDLV